LNHYSTPYRAIFAAPHLYVCRIRDTNSAGGGTLLDEGRDDLGDTGLIYTTITARISFAMARNGNAPRILERTTDNGVPLVGLVLAIVIGLVAFLPFPSWQQLVGFITSATVLSFASGPLVHASMRRQLTEQERPFRLPGGPVIPVLAFWGSNLIVYWSGWTIVWKPMVAVLIGFVLLGAFVGWAR
jgi:amino acid transporter